MQRKLAAVLSADIVGYGQLMQRDEAGTLARVRAAMNDVLGPRVTAQGGRVVKLMGDGALAEFASIVAAMRCAMEIQAAMGALDADLPAEMRLRYRIGVNLGDVIVQDDDIFGDGVNVAARLQALAPPGGVAFSRFVREQIEGKLAISFEDLGEHAMKNTERPVHVFAARAGADAPAGDSAAKDGVSICVMPFSNMSGDPEQEYFSDGVTEDIITDLSRISALSVVSRSTAFTFKGKAVEVGKVARQLGVNYVLEGSVRRAGNRVRISAQLIDGKADNHIWAERYDRDLNDIFALQTEISEAIVAALKLKLLPNEREALETRSSVNPAAYKLYLMARHYMWSPSRRHLELVARICRRILEIESGYASAWALLALSLMRLQESADDDEARRAAERAVELDPKLAEGHAALAVCHALAGDFEQALTAQALALKLDPDSVQAHRVAGRTFQMLHRYREAAHHYARASQLGHNSTSALQVQCLILLGEVAEARAVAARAMEVIEQTVAGFNDDGMVLANGATMLITLGEVDRARDWAERAMLLDPDNTTMLYNLACSFVDLGEVDAALDCLEQALQRASTELVQWTRTDTDFDPVRAHPRFIALMEAAEARLHGGDSAPAPRKRAKKKE